MRIVFFGTSDFGLETLDALKAKHTLLAVVTTPDKPSGRDLKSSASPVKGWAQENDVAHYDYFRKDSGPLLATLKELRADLFLVISFGALLSDDYLTAAPHGSLNVHASLLPKYRGASPMQSAILAGDPETGVSVMRMIERLDAGDVMLQKSLPVTPQDTTPSLKEGLSALSAKASLEAIDQIERQTAKFVVQDESRASLVKKIKKEDGRLDWTQDAIILDRRVRAFIGWPGSFFFFGGKRIAVLESRPAKGVPGQKSGTALDVTETGGLLVASGENSALQITELQLEGRRALPWKEFRRGYPLRGGELFE